MAQKSETPILLLTFIITIGLLCGVIWWFSRGGINVSQLANSTPTPSDSSPQSEAKSEKAGSPTSDLSSVPLTSDRGISYIPLRRSLEEKNLKQANEETTEALLKAFGAKSNQTGNVDIQEAANPPCSDIKTVDQLWSKASNGNLGFTTQRQILRETGDDYRQAYNKMQWQRPGGEWLIQYVYDGRRANFKPGYEPNYTNPDKGNLPTFERGYNFQYSFDGTLAKCGL